MTRLRRWGMLESMLEPMLYGLYGVLIGFFFGLWSRGR